MSDHHKIWIDAALHDLSASIYLHEGGYWFQATLNAQQAGEKLGKAILIYGGVAAVDIRPFSHRILKINEKIEVLGLHTFSEIDQNMARKMQRAYIEQKYPNESSDDAPYVLFDRIESEDGIQWALNYLDMTMHVIPDVVPMHERNSIQESFDHAKIVVNTCKVCHSAPCVCRKHKG